MSEGQSRLVVVETIYHQAPTAEPLGVECRYARLLNTDEQVYTRKTSANDNWSKLDLGWLKGQKTSLLRIKNLEGTDLTEVPTPEERKRIDGLVIELSFGSIPSADIAISPKESCRFQAASDQAILIRCASRGENARYLLHAFPR